MLCWCFLWISYLHIFVGIFHCRFYVYLKYTLLLVCLIDVMVSGRTVPNIIAAWPNAYRLLLHVHILQILEHLKAKKKIQTIYDSSIWYIHTCKICICPRPKSSNDSWAPFSESWNFWTFKWCEAFVSKCQLWPEIIHIIAKKNMDSNLQKIVLQLSDKGLENKQNCAI